MSVVFVTGGAGFIGSAVVRMGLAERAETIVIVDKLTYAGHLANLAEALDSPRFVFRRVDVADAAAVRALFEEFRPSGLIHLAAESHVDRSIDGPAAFVETNIVGTSVLLEASRAHWETLRGEERTGFRFLHVSTDEVFGSLGAEGFFTEETPYDPKSPYSASKAASDHLVRAWGHTYGLPVVLTNCSNNYGPYQFPEKLIPLVIRRAVQGLSLPVYGRGENIRDWLYVDDHARALWTAFDRGRPGRSYNIGGQSERRNLAVVERICGILDELRPLTDGRRYGDLITFVADRPGHDFRYAIDASRIHAELGWSPRETFETGLRRTVQWYLDHDAWCRTVLGEKESLERKGVR